jgi:hypothetical protein
MSPSIFHRLTGAQAITKYPFSSANWDWNLATCILLAAAAEQQGVFDIKLQHTHCSAYMAGVVFSHHEILISHFGFAAAAKKKKKKKKKKKGSAPQSWHTVFSLA